MYLYVVVDSHAVPTVQSPENKLEKSYCEQKDWLMRVVKPHYQGTSKAGDDGVW